MKTPEAAVVSRVRDESGTHLVEVSVAMVVLLVGMLGLTSAMSFGMTAVGGSKQRSVAAALATERLERVRELPFAQVALYQQPSHNADPSHPDYDVSQSGTSYNVDNSTTEPLIVDTSDGALRHVEDPHVSGKTETTIHQYVTWVDDSVIAGTFDYKRVTVVVTVARPLNGGVVARVTQSTFVGDGTVVVPAVTPVPSSPSPSATPVPTPTPAPSCAGDATSPTGSVTILSGAGADAGYTSSLTVQVQLEASDACPDLRGELSNDGVSFTHVADLVSGASSTVTWSVPAGDGLKTVYGRFVDGAGNISSVQSRTVVVDRTAPTVPGNLRVASCSMGSSDRTVSLTWDTSTDVYLAGYRLYRSVNSGAFAAVSTTSSQQASDTSKKSDSVVRYLVRAYDRAGNESADSNTLTFARNEC